jgi:hypothetical protein
MKIIDNAGKLLDDAKRVWDAGVVMDVGHGGGSFSFDTGQKLIEQGYKPDVISSEPNPHAAARLVEMLDAGGARRLGERFQRVLIWRVIGKAEELGIALMHHMDVVYWIGAARIDCVLGAFDRYQPEPAEKLLHFIEIGHAQPPESDVCHLCPRHGRFLPEALSYPV